MLGNVDSGLMGSKVSVEVAPVGLDERGYGSEYPGEANRLWPAARLP